MSDWTPTERVREAAFNAWQDTSASLTVRDRLDAVLAAVGPSIAAQAWAEGYGVGYDDQRYRDTTRPYPQNPYEEAGR